MSCAEIKSLVRSLVPEGDLHFGFMPAVLQGCEQLKSLIAADTDAECSLLLRDPIFRHKLDGAITEKLKAVCEDHGFVWRGFVFMSDERKKRDFNGSYGAWLSLPGEPALVA